MSEQAKILLTFLWCGTTARNCSQKLFVEIVRRSCSQKLFGHPLIKLLIQNVFSNIITNYFCKIILKWSEQAKNISNFLWYGPTARNCLKEMKSPIKLLTSTNPCI